MNESYINGYLKCHHTITENPNPNDFYMHTHDVCEIFFFMKGDASYYVEGNVYDLKENDILIMRQGETHKLQVNENCTYERTSIHFSPSIINDFFKEDWLRPFYSRELGRMNLYRGNNFSSDYYLSCISTIINCIEEEKSEEHIIASLIPLLVEICDAYDKRGNKDYIIKGNSIPIQIVDYINKNLFKKINLDIISKEFFISKSQANRVFRNAIGSSIWEYISIKRLMAAKEMLSSGLGAQETAEKCGFSDYSSFFRAYKKQFNSSPKNDCKKDKLK